MNSNRMFLDKIDIQLSPKFWDLVEIKLKETLTMLQIQKVRSFFIYLEEERKKNHTLRLKLLAEHQTMEKRLQRMVKLLLLLHTYISKVYDEEQAKIIKKITFFYYFDVDFVEFLRKEDTFNTHIKQFIQISWEKFDLIGKPELTDQALFKYITQNLMHYGFFEVTNGLFVKNSNMSKIIQIKKNKLNFHINIHDIFERLNLLEDLNFHLYGQITTFSKETNNMCIVNNHNIFVNGYIYKEAFLVLIQEKIPGKSPNFLVYVGQVMEDKKIDITLQTKNVLTSLLENTFKQMYYHVQTVLKNPETPLEIENFMDSLKYI